MAAPRYCSVQLDWAGTALRLPPVIAARFRTVRIDPCPPDHPFGRKGAMLAGAFRQLGYWDGKRIAAGLLVLDGDVAIDPHDLAAMDRAIGADPGTIHVGPAKLWKSTTGRGTWEWAHRKGPPGQVSVPDPDVWTFNFTYLPAALIERAELREWAFPEVDIRLSALAKKLGIPARTVPDCHPKHLHY